MFWDDGDHCIFVEFFGTYQNGDRARISSALIKEYEELCLPYSLRIGFHKTEEVARKTMMEWLDSQDS